MNLSKSVRNAMRFVSEAAMRIFSLSDDKYPVVGVQPFEGKPLKDKSAD
ncbi:isochorismate synthase [Kamptonema sp. UHCC 0994]|nr:isochorismate synthase [Kamptonema sp. UHCC 0994]MDF0556470.1 isochorismate synthase [Kamptonema sp. UHCC 0994]